ncbi:hypothetical protein CLOM_g10816 [Closterium sp. NIES-68]|nr:hypothetical protein CLOM_g10816 [Closterium sp. NIES-68]GJP57678.1 hypothetical protein CLOP_g17098 [Closterium sp. NIES-67]
MSGVRVFSFHIGDSDSEQVQTNSSRSTSSDSSSDSRDDRTDSRQRIVGDPVRAESGEKISFRTRRGSASLRVSVLEHLGQDVGLHTWPSAVVLGEYLWQQQGLIQGRSVIELGAGTGLCGLLCAKLGARVTLTDAHTQSQVLSTLQRAAEQNGFSCTDTTGTGCMRTHNTEEGHSGSDQTFPHPSSSNVVRVMPLTWGDLNPDVFNLPPADVIIGADVLYDASAFEPLLATAHFLLGLKQGSVFITAYQARSTHASLHLLMQSWGLTCIHMVSADDFMPANKLATLGGSEIYVAVIASVADPFIPSHMVALYL